MGVDTYIFDEVSKECFYFDRNHHFFMFVDAKGDGVYEKVMYHNNVGKDHDIRFTAVEIAHCCDVNLAHPGEGCRNEGHDEYWNTLIKRFVTERPDGRFWFRNDHQSPESWDYLDRNGGEYKEVEYR